MAIGQISFFYDRLSILSIKNIKSLTSGSIASAKLSRKYRLIVSPETISIDPSLIVPSYVLGDLLGWKIIQQDAAALSGTSTMGKEAAARHQGPASLAQS
jgi:hypothetical protein